MKKIKKIETTESQHFQQNVKTIQRLFRSKQRANLHQRIFHEKPRATLKHNAWLSTHPHIRKIIQALAQQKAIINHTVHHWTSTDNLKQILKTGYLYGNKVLTKYNIEFEKNSLTYSDTLNGDASVICCAPFLVCPTALTSGNKLRKNLIRLSIDLDKIDSQGTYNQFFKIHDFCGPDFTSTIKITDDLTIHFYKSKINFTIGFEFKKSLHQIRLNKPECIFYGNLTQINAFCLHTFFSAIEKITDPHFQASLYDYLNNCSDCEIKKILMCFAQNMTILSEYNFNCALPFTPHLINEVYVADQQTTLPLTQNTLAQKQEILQEIADDEIIFSNTDYLKSIPNPLLSYADSKKKTDDLAIRKKYLVTQNGYQMHVVASDIWKKKFDFSFIPAIEFATPNYVETRQGEQFSKSFPTKPAPLKLSAVQKNKKMRKALKLDHINLNQDILREKMVYFLQDLYKREGRDKKKLIALIETIAPGHCYGLSFLWNYAQYISAREREYYKNKLALPQHDNAKWFNNIVRSIYHYQNLNELNSTQIKEMERFISLMIYYHSNFSSCDFRDVFFDDDNKILRKEYTISLPLTPNLLQDALALLLKPNQLVFILTHHHDYSSHVTAVFQHENTFSLFDAYNELGEQKFTSLADLASALFSSAHYTLQETSPAPFSFMIYSLDRINRPSYPSQKTLITHLLKNISESPSAWVSFIDEKHDATNAFLSACMINCLASAKALLALKPKINHFDAFDIVIQKNHTDLLKLLIANGFDINERFENGYTAIHMAAEYGTVACLKILLKAGANVNGLGPETTSAAFLAAKAGHAEIIQLLAAYGADLNIASNLQTPAYIAAEEGHLEALKALARAGVDVSLTSPYGLSPMDIAAGLGHTEIVEFLQAFADAKNTFKTEPTYKHG